MRLAVTTMEREGFEVSLLFAERLDFYARFGWRPVTRQFSALADTQTMRAAAGFRLARFEQARDLGRSPRSIAAIAAASTAPRCATRLDGAAISATRGILANTSSCAAATRRMGSWPMRAR